jgi:hypothetical protein
MLKSLRSLGLFFLLAACAPPSVSAIKTPPQPAFVRTKIYLNTAEVETQTSAYPANDATITAILASKYALGTAMAGTMTAQPSETPLPILPTIPLDSAYCGPDGLKSTFGWDGAAGNILFGAVLTNIRDVPCFMQAWPQVILVNRQGKPLDSDYGYFDTNADDAALAATAQAQESATAKIGVRPGWTASLSLNWQNWCAAGVQDGVIIRLTLFDNLGALDIPADFGWTGKCESLPGARSFVSISKFGPASPPQ